MTFTAIVSPKGDQNDCVLDSLEVAKCRQRHTGIIQCNHGREDSLTISWAVLIQYQRVTDGQTDRRTDVQHSYNVR